MPETLRAVIVVGFLATAVFALAKAPLCAAASAPADFKRRRNLWFGLTLAAFLAHNFWICMVVAAVLLVLAMRNESNPLALFFFVLFAIPAMRAEIPGLGVVSQLFALDYLRLLALVVLLPAYLRLRSQPGVEPFGRSATDKLLGGYLLLQFVLMLPLGSFTNCLRNGVLYPFLGIFLPYYVASRGVRTLEQFRDVLAAFVAAALVLSAIGAFEYLKGWLLYASVDEALGVRWDFIAYMQRGGGLRAMASAGGAIQLGYAVTVALAFYLFLRRSIASQLAWRAGLLVLIAGVFAPVSRTPWIGAAAVALVFITLGPSPVKGYVKLAALGAIGGSVALATPMGEKLLNLLPFVGTEQQFNVDYRERLATVSYQLIMQRPFFGTPDYLQLAEMQQLIQGQGIIDMVNSYAGIGLASGLVGLFLFAGALVASLFSLYRGLRSIRDKTSELHLLGQALIAALIGAMLIIGGVSSVMAIPVIYWSLAGLCVACAQLTRSARAPALQPRAAAMHAMPPVAQTKA